MNLLFIIEQHCMPLLDRLVPVNVDLLVIVLPDVHGHNYCS